MQGFVFIFLAIVAGPFLITAGFDKLNRRPLVFSLGKPQFYTNLNPSGGIPSRPERVVKREQRSSISAFKSHLI